MSHGTLPYQSEVIDLCCAIVVSLSGAETGRGSNVPGPEEGVIEDYQVTTAKIV